MCENVRHIERGILESRESYVARCRERGLELPCRMCDECARSVEARIVGDFVAHKQTAQRCIMALLTYDDRILIRAGRQNAYRMTIEEAKEDARLWVVNVRKVMRRMHKALKIKVDACRVTETRQLADASTQSVDRWGFVQRAKAPRITTPPRVHHHVVVWFTIAWKDAARQAREPAQWRDNLIPRLRTDEWLYEHTWETKAEARKRKGRVRESSTPWGLGMVSYSEPKGGEGSYMAKYLSKSMRLRQQYKADRYRDWTAEELLDFQRAEASWKSFRKSPGLGHEYYKRIGRLQAEAGLPPRLAFQANIDVADGGLYKRSVTVHGGFQYIDASGTLRTDTARRKVYASFMLQRVGRQRALLTAYDARRRELFGDAREPTGPNYRTKRLPSGREIQVIVYGLEEAREQIAKDDDRRYIAKRDRQLAKARRKHPGNRELDRLAGKLADELAFGVAEPSPHGGRRRRKGEATDAWARRQHLRNNPFKRGDSRAPERAVGGPMWVRCAAVAVTPTDIGATVIAWEGKFERDVLRKVSGEVRDHAAEARHYRDLRTWLRHQPALIGQGDELVRRLADRMRERWRLRWLALEHGGAQWKPWRKGRMKAGVVCG